MSAKRSVDSGMTADERRIIAASSAGTVFEWYDFYLYGSLAATIGSHYFSAYTETQQGIFALLTFAAGFIVRPVGAVLFGRLGDSIGRKHTFVTTVILMGAATFLVGLLPGYDSIGIAAPIGLVLLRMLQGLAAGGEYGGAAIYVAEHAPENKRAYFTSWINTASALALLLSLIVISLTQISVDAMFPAVDYAGGKRSAFQAWGWRIPFLLSIVLLGISLYIRLRMNESPAFERIRDAGQLSKAPLTEAFREPRHLKTGLLALFGLVAGQAVVWYTSHFYALFFLQNVLRVDQFTTNVLMSWAIVLAVPFVVIFAAISDRIGRKPMILGGCALAALVYFPLFEALTRTANPALYLANASTRITLTADPATCSFMFNPTGAAKFRSPCDIAKSMLTKNGVAYRMQPAAADRPTSIQVGSSAPLAVDTEGFATVLAGALKDAGFPQPGDPSIVRIRLEADAGAANIVKFFSVFEPQKLQVIGVLATLMLLAAMVYGPMAAALVELFPTRIRYTAVSVPYHIGNGWFGGLMPATAFAMVAATGDIYFGLWYPVIIACVTAVLGFFFLPEMRWNDPDA